MISERSGVEFWWDVGVDPDYRAELLWQYVRALEAGQYTVHAQNLVNARLYSNRELSAFDWGHGEVVTGTLAPISRLTENLILSVVDTMVSMLGKQRPKAVIITKDADFRTHRKAVMLERALYGEFLHQHVYEKASQVVRDAMLFGFGCWRVDVDGGELCVERVFPDEIVVDHTECLTDPQPLQVFRRRVLPTEAVVAAYASDDPELAERIREQATRRAYTSYRWPGEGHVVVTEGYRRQTPDQPGRHLTSIRNVVLEDEEWPFDWFPFVFFHYQLPITGFYSPSAVEMLLPYQLRLNELNLVIRDAQDLMARPRLLVANGSQVNLTSLDNRIARVINYTGQKPEAVQWQAVSAELYNERDRLVRNAFEFFGLSQMQGLQRLPAGARLDSSKAIDAATATNDDRFADVSQRWERGYLDLAETIVRTCAAYSKGWGNHPAVELKTTWRDKRVAGTFSWKDYDLDRDRYVMQVAAASILNETPAARYDTVADWVQKGLVSPAQGQQLMDHPDLEGATALFKAPVEDIDGVIEDIENGVPTYPTPLQDLPQGVQRVTFAYLRDKRLMKRDERGNVESAEDRAVLRAYIDWITAARAIMKKGVPDQGLAGSAAVTPPPSGQPQAPMPMPMAAPAGVPLQ